MLSKNGILLLWNPGPFMAKASKLIEFWGLNYVNVTLVWRKLNKRGSAY